jgi:plasmid stabilization system protein ParE
MIHNVVITDRAARDLNEAYLWYAAHAPDAAARWYNGFLDALDKLTTNPERCPIAPESKKLHAEIRQLLYGQQRSYRALFLIRKQTVIVLHIRHTARREASTDELL